MASDLGAGRDMHVTYMSVGNSLRHICNQVSLERIHVYEIEHADRLEVEAGQPLDWLLDAKSTPRR